MAKSASPLFSLEARGKLAGLRLSHRHNNGQVVTASPVPRDARTPLQLQYRARHALLTATWQRYLADPPNTYCWDRSRRYGRRPGTGYTEFLHWNLLRAVGAPIHTIYGIGMSRNIFPGRIVFWAYLSEHPLFVYIDWGPTPGFPIWVGGCLHWEGPLWLGNYPDPAPGKRLYCRFRCVLPFGWVSYSFSGLTATTPYG